MNTKQKEINLLKKYINKSEITNEPLFPIDSNTLTPQMKKKVNDAIKMAKEFTAAPCIHGVMSDETEKWLIEKGKQYTDLLDELKGIRIPLHKLQELKNHHKSYQYYCKKYGEKYGVVEEEPIEVQEGKKILKELQALAIEYIENKKNNSLTTEWLMNQGKRFIDISQSPLKYKLPYPLHCTWGCIVHDIYYEIKNSLPKQENELEEIINKINTLSSKKSKEERLWEEVTSDITIY